MIIVVSLVSILGWVLCFVLSIVWMYRMLDRKGYRYPHILLWLVAFGPIAALLVSIGFVIQLSAINTTDITSILLLSLVFYVPLLASTSLFALILRHVVPAKQRTGPQGVRFPYRGASRLLSAASAVVPVVTMVALHVSASTALHLFLPLAMSAAICSALGRRARTPRLEETVWADARPLVLYLRPFDDEERVFAELPRRARKVLKHWSNAYIQDPNDKLYQTFEEFFADSVAKGLGPFVALGSPQDTLPPLGAARTYVPDDRWQGELKRLAAEALCILAPVSQSPNLQWELNYLRQEGLHEKLFILTPPRTSRPLISRLARLTDFLIRLLTIGGLKRMKPMSWTDFRARLAELGYILPVTDPGLGSIVTFDMTGNSMTLMQGAGTAHEYVEAIAVRLSQAPVKAHEST